ncbi:MAG: hypothetical protein ACRDK7_00440 [Solirubrobacteraceae bacterium]
MSDPGTPGSGEEPAQDEGGQEELIVSDEDEVQPANRARLEQVSAEVLGIVQAAREGTPVADARPIESLDPERQAALDDRKQDTGLKKMYARWLLGLLWTQMFVADGVFVAYAWAGLHWKLPTDVIQVWLAATLVQIVGVVTVVTRYLFPRRDGSQDPPSGG